MSRTIGATDLKKRKKRKDAKYKYRKKHSRTLDSVYFVPYKPKRKKNDPIKVWFFEKRPMSKEGYYNWNAKSRPKICPFVYYPVEKPFYVETSQIESPEAVGELAKNFIQYGGSFQMRMPGHAKNKGNASYYKKATIVIHENAQTGELDVQVIDFWRMARYWFWVGSQK